MAPATGTDSSRAIVAKPKKKKRHPGRLPWRGQVGAGSGKGGNDWNGNGGRQWRAGAAAWPEEVGDGEGAVVADEGGVGAVGGWRGREAVEGWRRRWWISWWWRTAWPVVKGQQETAVEGTGGWAVTGRKGQRSLGRTAGSRGRRAVGGGGRRE